MSVLITGMGIVSALGKNQEETLNSIKKAKNTLSQITTIPNSNKLSSQIAGEVIVKNIENLTDKSEILAYYAIKEALQDSGLDFTKINPQKYAVVFATCNGKILEFEKTFKNFDTSSNLLEQSSEQCSLSNNLKNMFGLKGANFNIVSSCCASSHALIFASHLIKSKKFDMVLVCGTDSLSETTLGGFNSLQAISRNGASPFSEEIGLSLGEGAGCMILETPEHAKNRNAKVRVQILGTGFFADAYHNTSPDMDASGLTRSIDKALKDSKINKKDIKIICAHGTGTMTNDSIESRAIQNYFKETAMDLHITSTKSMTGHTLGASGIIQAIIMTGCMHKNIVPAIINFKNNRIGCELNYVKNKPLENISYDYFLANNLAFGGNNSAIVFAKPHYLNLNNNQQQEKAVITGYCSIAPELQNFETKTKIQTPKAIVFENFSLDIGEDRTLRRFKKAPKNAQFGIDVTKKMLDKANLNDLEIRKNIGVIWNHYIGNLKAFEDTYFEILQFGIGNCPALSFADTVFSSTSGYVSSALKLKGQQTSFWSQFSPFAGIYYAKELIEQNQEKMFIIGASEELSKYGERMRDEKDNEDKATSEGASVILVESESSAKNRQAEIYAEIVNVSINNTNFEECILDALNKSNLKKEDINLNLHSDFGAYQKPFFENAIKPSEYIGTLLSASILVNIEIAIKLFKTEKLNYISLTARTLSGTNYCLILKNPKSF